MKKRKQNGSIDKRVVSLMCQENKNIAVIGGHQRIKYFKKLKAT